MLEKEAKKCWCPFSRVSVAEGEGGWNRSGDALGNEVVWPDAATCIGSRCMAWRSDAQDNKRFSREKPPGDGWVRDGDWREDAPFGHLWRRTGAGHCGLVPSR